MNKAIIMFVMLLGSFTYAQTFDFDCIDYAKLRADRVTDVEALGNTEVFALLAIQEDPAETTTIIFNKQLTAYVDVVYSHVERWEQSDYDAYLTDLEDKVNAQIIRNERLIILEAAFNQYSTDAVSISLTSDANGDAILFDGGVYSRTLSFGALLEELHPLTWESVWISQFVFYRNLVQTELDSIAAAALVAANEANEAAYTAALDSNTATSTLGREIELEELSRDGVFLEITFPSWGGYQEKYVDADGNSILDAEGDPQTFVYNPELDSVPDYDTTFNKAVGRVRDLVHNLINN